MRKWRIEDSEELYNITGWGTSYFSINDKGHVVVTPRKNGVAVDLKELVDELQLRDVAAPMLVRFPDILDNRIEKISNCFKQASEEYGYKAENFIIYPIKVTRHRLPQRVMSLTGGPSSAEIFWAKTKIRSFRPSSCRRLWERSCPTMSSISPPDRSRVSSSSSRTITGRVSTAPESRGTSRRKRKNRFPPLSWENAGSSRRLPRRCAWFVGYSISTTP